MTGSVLYEEIGCVGFQPQLNRLEAVVFVNQPSGYGGDICSAGTPEYVRFYLSFDNGATWEDQGVTSFRAHDIPKGTKGSKRLEYAVALEVKPRKRSCKIENTILARAILSWTFEPPADDPDYMPVWGNVHDTHILVDPFKFTIEFPDFAELFEGKLQSQLSLIDPKQELTLAKPKQLSLAELAKKYKGKVEPHRFGLANIQKMLAQPGQIEDLIAAGQLDEAQSFAQKRGVMSCSIFLEEPDFFFGVLLGDRDSGFQGGDMPTEVVFINMFYSNDGFLRQDPRFRNLVVDSGLLEYWRKWGWSDYCEPDGNSFRCD